MTELEKLRAIRDVLVEERRQEVSRALAGAPGAYGTWVERIEQIQDRIEVLDRVIADEQQLAPSAFDAMVG